MSEFVSKLSEIDFKRSLAHIFPGILLYLGLLMALDLFIFEEQSSITSIIFRPATADLEALVSLIGIGIFVGSILGIMIDGIGHWIFEDKLFDRVIKNRPLSNDDPMTIGDAEQYIYGHWKKRFGIADLYLGPGPLKIPNISDYLYPFTFKSNDGEDKIKLKDNLVSDYYSYFEFYLNSSISLSIVSIVLGFFALSILNIDLIHSLVISAIVLGGSFGLFLASIHSLEDYKKARVFAIEGYLRKRQEEKW
jgi:Co/Zn/Cd efflux system component